MRPAWGRVHKGLYHDAIDVPSSLLSILFPSQQQHFESTPSIKKAWPDPPEQRGSRGARGGEAGGFQLFMYSFSEQLCVGGLTFALFALFL